MTQRGTQPCFVIMLATVLALCLGGCCEPVRPTEGQVRSWISQSLPAGSSEVQVKQFCASHGFHYYPCTNIDSQSDIHAATASRRVGGCEWSRPVIIVDVLYDRGDRVKSVTVRGGSMLP